MEKIIWRNQIILKDETDEIGIVYKLGNNYAWSDKISTFVEAINEESPDTYSQGSLPRDWDYLLPIDEIEDQTILNALEQYFKWFSSQRVKFENRIGTFLTVVNILILILLLALGVYAPTHGYASLVESPWGWSVLLWLSVLAASIYWIYWLNTKWRLIRLKKILGI